MLDETRLRFVLWHLLCNSSAWSITNLLSFIDCFKPTRHLWKIDLKGSSMSSSVAKPLMPFLLSLLECIRRLSSLSFHGMKFILVVRWIFYFRFSKVVYRITKIWPNVSNKNPWLIVFITIFTSVVNIPIIGGACNIFWFVVVAYVK